MNTLQHCVYVLLSIKDGKHYVGYTSDLDRRIMEHESGKSKSTALRRPFILLHAEYYLSKKDAQRRELYLKTTGGRRTLRLMLRDSLSNSRDT